ncbi:MAG: helix-turn-helix domain-containing protein [Deltaproteobacteria bacterium]|nr:helix-turn-helix domain-containing protein [Deltaproteobacteria bacterium]
MKEQEVIEEAVSDDFGSDFEELDHLDDDVEAAMPDWDRWNDDLKKLLPEKEQHEEPPPKRPTAVSAPKPAEPAPDARVSEKRPEDMSGSGDLITSDKQLLFFIQKYGKADRICKEAGISLQTLQRKVGQLSYRLKRYINVEGLYRETRPVKLTSDGITISANHLVETDFTTGDRFKVGFKGRYIILSKI